MTTLAVLQILVGLDPRGVTAGAAQVNSSLAGVGKTARGALGTAVPLGATAAGLAVGLFAKRSVDAAIDFDRSFTRIAAISNAAAGDIERWKGEVMDLAGETAQAPVELADALFFLASAGLDVNDVMPALEASARGAASGLGETADVANIVASAMNAYADSGLQAAQVTDTLIAAVREGRAEPEEFANALGRILPIASQAGVTFDQVSASLAALSNIGLDVNEGVTAMRGVIQGIIAPGSMAAEAMNEIGLSAQDMLDVISEDGIIGALRTLDKAARQNTSGQAEYIGVLRKIIPNVRSLTGVLGLTGQEAAKVDAIFDNVMKSTGSLADAFKTTAESDAFKLQKALNDIAIVGQEVATSALPGLVSLLQNLAPVIEMAARNLDVLVLTMVAFSIGTKAAAAGAVAFGGALGPIAGIIAGAVVAGRALNDILFENDMSFEALASTLDTHVTQAYEEGFLSVEKFLAAKKALEDGDFGSAALTSAVSGVAAYQAGLQELTAEQNSYVAGAAPVIDATNGITGATQRNAEAHREAAAAAREQRNAEVALAGGFLGLIGQANELAAAQAELTRMQENGRQGSEKYRETSLRVLEAGVSLKQGILDYAASLDEAGATSGQVIGRVKTLAREFGLQKGDVADLIGQVRGLIGRYAAVPERVETDVKANTTQADRALVALETKLLALTIRDWAANIRITTSGGSTGFVLIERLERALADVTSRERHVDINVSVVEDLQSELGGVVEAIRAAAEGLEGAELARAERFRDAWLDQAKAYRLQGKELSAILSKAERGLERLQDKAETFAAQVRSGFDLDLVGGLMGLEELTATTGADFLRKQLADAQAFAGTLTELADKGLSGAGLAELASQGPGGLPLAQLLLGSPELMQQFNDTQAALAELQGSVAKNLIDEVFGPRLEAAGEELARAQERVAKFAERLQRFLEDLRADAVANEVDGIVEALRRLGGMLARVMDGDGGNGGRGAADRMGDMAAPAIGRLEGGEWGNTYITVQGSLWKTEELVDALEKERFQRRRRNGRLPSDA